jgi:cofilin
MSQHVAKLEDGTENHLKTGGEQITYANKATAGSVDPRCKEVFTQLKIRRKHRYIVYKIDPETEAVVVETIGARDADLDALLRALPDADSRYCIFDHAYKTYDGRPANKLFFLSWFPSNATPYSKMAYTHAKEHVREVFTGVFDIMARTTDEARSLVTGEAESESDQEFDDDDF